MHGSYFGSVILRGCAVEVLLPDCVHLLGACCATCWNGYRAAANISEAVGIVLYACFLLPAALA